MGWVVNTTPRPLSPGKETRYPLYRRLGGPVWTAAENLAPPGFNPRIVQPVASRYTDYAIPAPKVTSHRVCIIQVRYFICKAGFATLYRLAEAINVAHSTGSRHARGRGVTAGSNSCEIK